MPRIKPLSWLLLLFTGLLYVFVEYSVMRHETLTLIICLTILFLIYLWIVRSIDDYEVSFWIAVSIGFRASLLLALPNLSDDFYRFIWDGRLLAAGYHPFAELPRYYIENKANIPGINNELFKLLNSPDYFTIYPPVNQFVFWLSAKISPQSILGSVVVIRSLIIAAEVGSLLMIRKILKHYDLPAKNVLLYALNPLIILELTGNLHFEAFMIFFLLASFLFLIKGKLWGSALNFGLAICSKLIPIIFLPLLLTRLGLKRSLQFYAITAFCCMLLFLPLLSIDIISGFRESIGYYFKKFEFNASIYYIIREWGFWKYGYNIIQTVGWRLAMYSALLILFYTLLEGIKSYSLKSIFEKLSTISVGLKEIDSQLLTSSLFVLFIYFAFSTIVHPWYITTLVAFSVFGRYRFALLWSALIFITYANYRADGFEENLWFTAIQYVLVFGYLAYELIAPRKVDEKSIS
ncbi:MAG: hypothetical protein JJE09_02965 [Bacteroidia bacterium]|nr:hypothetical protein [Bacteroidia bacterium]